ncbi:TetR/AcrR family transcriptional regulator [Tomitella biformata]|uniref:TetR/AcrR family transcriptional regulator n=1 Tax=Tomitella biformata TaxID=630403 RepID=UPI0004B5C4C1|nr:TetR/AcrR family transcriptional regulator [Tomitella biformata]
MTETTARPSPARAAMIDAAERIVAERGLSELTLRQVQIAAGQSNKSAAQYHFGSRDGLITAILEDRVAGVELRRREMLDRVAQPGPRDLVAALVVPLAERILSHPNSTYGRFLAQSMLDPELADLIQAHLLARGFLEVQQRLRVYSALPFDVASWRVDSLAGYVIGALAAAEARPLHTLPTDVITASLIDACLNILTGPQSTPRSNR